jgi:beta-glucanase (GH16 family)
LQYYNDTTEMDMEFLSKDFHASNSSYPVNLVLQSREAAQNGYNAQLTGNFIEAYLPFDPTTGFHEYRMDFIPNKVLFYADGQLLGQMNGSAVPTTAGHLVLQHWSNGNPLWSGGPPTNDAVLAVGYVKAYFNSSTMERHRDWALRCRGRTEPNSVCVIPEVSPSNSTPGQFFFSDQNDMANNQTVCGKNAGSRLEEARWPILSVLVLVGAWTLDLW